MSNETLMPSRTDEIIQELVQEELRWDSHITDAAAIGVAVTRGVVTLSGQVFNFAQKIAAQDAAHRVMGVQDVANDITVFYADSLSRTDVEIAQAVRNALEWDALVPEQTIRSTVSVGWVTLDGNVSRWSQRADAERALRNLAGVRGVTNNLEVVSGEPTPAPAAVRQAIELALDRQTKREVRRLGVSVQEGTVTLTGTVRSWPEKVAASGAAGFAPGVRHVDNRLRIDPNG